MSEWVLAMKKLDDSSLLLYEIVIMMKQFGYIGKNTYKCLILVGKTVDFRIFHRIDVNKC